MNDLTVGDFADRYNLSPETVRKWAREFERHLSNGANPDETGSHRRFTFEDFEVLAYVAECRDQKLPFEDIHAGLDSGQRAVPKAGNNAIVPAEFQQQMQIIGKRLDQLEAEKAELQKKVQAEHDRAERAEGAQKALEAQIERLQDQIIQLNIRLVRDENPTTNQ